MSGFAFIACTEESKPYYGSWYVNSASSSAVVTIDKNGVTMLDTYFDDYKVDGNKLIINDTDTGYRFYENYDVLCDETIINFDTGTIPVRDGYFSADLYNFSYDGGFLIAYKFYQDGRVEYLNVNNPLRNASGTYHLKNGVLDLDMMTSLGTDADFSYNYVTKMGTLYTDVFLRGGESYFDGLEPSRNESESNDKHSSEENQAEFFQVKFDYEYEQADNEINIQKGGVVQLETPQREGYTFDGWEIDGQIKKGGDIITVMQDITAYAQWTLDTYTITYHLNGGALVDGRKDFTIKNLPYTLPIPQGTDTQSFLKWTTDEVGENEITHITELKNYTLYAHYEDSSSFLSYKYDEELQGCVVSDYTGNAKTVKIPSTYKGVPIVAIGVYAFGGCDSLTSVEIPNSVTLIDSYAFSYCHNLTSVEIPDSVTSIGASAFGDCTSLTSIEIPDSVTSIGGYAFSGCSSLTNVEIPDGVTSIGDQAFGYCRSLTIIEIPDSVTWIGAGAFNECISLISVIIGDGVTDILGGTFSGCYSLKNLTIGDNVSKVECDFCWCSSLTSFKIPENITYFCPFGDGLTNLKTILIDSSDVANCSWIGDIIRYSKDVYVRVGITVTATVYNVFYDNKGAVEIDGVEYYHYQIKGE